MESICVKETCLTRIVGIKPSYCRTSKLLLTVHLDLTTTKFRTEPTTLPTTTSSSKTETTVVTHDSFEDIYGKTTGKIFVIEMQEII